MSVNVVEVTAMTPEIVAGFERLLPQLAPRAPQLGARELGEIVAGPATTLFVARREDMIVGAVTLVVFRIPSGLRARIESLVVDAGARGGGVGAALCRVALERARERGADTVDLTSSPSREAANRLYHRLGFAQRTTNVYRYTFAGAKP
jgi:ribosomal protein S18 acetylase RimI-like enzyme